MTTLANYAIFFKSNFMQSKEPNKVAFCSVNWQTLMRRSHLTLTTFGMDVNIVNTN